MKDLSRASLGELLEEAVERDLIDHCSIRKGRIGITLGKLDLVFSSSDACYLLRLLMSGVGIANDPGDTESPDLHSVAPTPRKEEGRIGPASSVVEVSAQESYQKRELFRAQQEEATEKTAVTPEPTTQAGGDGNASPAETVSEEYLDSMLSFALAMHIIDSYVKDRDAGTVTLRTGGTSTGLSNWETIEYLSNSMLYELRSRTEE